VGMLARFFGGRKEAKSQEKPVPLVMGCKTRNLPDWTFRTIEYSGTERADLVFLNESLVVQYHEKQYANVKIVDMTKPQFFLIKNKATHKKVVRVSDEQFVIVTPEVIECWSCRDFPVVKKNFEIKLDVKLEKDEATHLDHVKMQPNSQYLLITQNKTKLDPDYHYHRSSYISYVFVLDVQTQKMLTIEVSEFSIHDVGLVSDAQLVLSMRKVGQELEEPFDGLWLCAIDMQTNQYQLAGEPALKNVLIDSLFTWINRACFVAQVDATDEIAEQYHFDWDQFYYRLQLYNVVNGAVVLQETIEEIDGDDSVFVSEESLVFNGEWSYMYEYDLVTGKTVHFTDFDVKEYASNKPYCALSGSRLGFINGPNQVVFGELTSWIKKKENAEAQLKDLKEYLQQNSPLNLSLIYNIMNYARPAQYTEPLENKISADKAGKCVVM
jgi:hypothetical protein